MQYSTKEFFFCFGFFFYWLFVWWLISVNWLSGWLIDWLFDWLSMCWFVDSLIHNRNSKSYNSFFVLYTSAELFSFLLLMHFSTSCFLFVTIGWSIHFSAGWLVGWGWTVNWSIDRPIIQSIGCASVGKTSPVPAREGSLTTSYRNLDRFALFDAPGNLLQYRSKLFIARWILLGLYSIPSICSSICI